MSITFSICHRDSNPRPLDHESYPITTRPGLPPFSNLLLSVQSEFRQLLFAVVNPVNVPQFRDFWTCFLDVEGTKRMKQMMTLLPITSQFIPHNRRRSKQLRKQMLNNCGWLTDVNSVFRMFSWFDIALR